MGNVKFYENLSAVPVVVCVKAEESEILKRYSGGTLTRKINK